MNTRNNNVIEKKSHHSSSSLTYTFKNTALAYDRSYGGNGDNLIELIQNNDCQHILSSAVDGNELANAFSHAGAKGHINLLRVCLENGISVDIKDKTSQTTALIRACISGNVEAVQLLLVYNPNIDSSSSDGYTSLMGASAYGSVDIVEMLLERNVNIDFQTRSGKTALTYACLNGHQEIVQLLLNHGADKDLKDVHGETPMDAANIEAIKELLRNHVNNTFVLK